MQNQFQKKQYHAKRYSDELTKMQRYYTSFWKCFSKFSQNKIKQFVKSTSYELIIKFMQQFPDSKSALFKHVDRKLKKG